MKILIRIYYFEVSNMNDKLDDLLDIIVKEVDPDKVILFGSRARGDEDAYSDYDIIIVKENLNNGRALLRKVYISLSGMGAPVDLIIVDGKVLRENIDDPYLIYGEALKEGRVLYAKA